MRLFRKTLASFFLGVRSFLFMVSFFAVTILLIGFFCWVLLLPERYVYVHVRLWSYLITLCLKYIAGITSQVIGLENIPPGPAIIAMRHESTWETVVMFLYIRHLTFVVKEELTWIPFFNLFLRKFRCISVKRGQKGANVRTFLKQGKELLAKEYHLLIFPEGSRMAPGTLRPFRGGLGLLYGQAGVPVIPAVLNSGRCWPRRRFYKFPGTVTLRFLPAIPAGMPRECFLEHFTQLFTEAYQELEEGGGS
ncbi:MAG: 1-acyl-sn-glycerol-3-phosphate acyltransferase [Holosporales bacterium]|jgi:1-acyl-sn-glycerol-3-phosphate acyltransferase|nr:1-acyl-sn-glycerol-3-phosphate acyltransferase [Holosporales bacterium]